MAGRTDDASYEAAIARLGLAARHEAEILSHLETVLHGEAFRGSPRSQAFLKHIVDRALHGDPSDLRERSIGAALFGRPPSYDTAEDAIVRVTASDVRKRLLQHYGKEGAQARVRISLPPGSYVPEFAFQAPAGGPAHAGHSNHELVGIVATAGETTFPLPVQSRWRRATPVLALAAICFALVLWWSPWSRLSPEKRQGSLIEAAFQKAPSLQVVVADDTLVLIQVLLNRRFSLQEYENLSYLQLPELVQRKELHRFWGSLSTRQLTNVGDLQNASRLVEMLRAGNRDVSVRHARQMHARDFRQGSYVILGSSVSNPWASLFTLPESNFPFGELPPPGLPEVILNRQPLPGEPRQFTVFLDPATGRKITYARVTLVDNLTKSGRVLLVEGQSMSATEMAGQFLLRQDSGERIRKLLSLGSTNPLPELEMVLKVSEQNEIGDQVELVSARTITRRSAAGK